MKEVLCTDGVLIWTEVHYQYTKDGKGDSLDTCLDAWLSEPVEPLTRLTKIEDFLSTIGAQKNKFVVFHMEGLQEQIDSIRGRVDATHEWALKQVEEAENRTLTLVHLLRESNKKSQFARRSRPSRSDKFRERVKAIMRKERKNGCSLDEVIHAWRNNQIDGLKLTYEQEKDVYFVDDENAVEELRKFSYRQLRTIFTESF